MSFPALKHICLSILFVTWIAGCSVFEKEEESPRDFLAEMRMHAETFREEAVARGVNVADLMSRVVFKEEAEIIFEGQSLCGFAPWYSDPTTDDLTISIVTDETCWSGRPEADNEALIFHELGHMVLDRGHRDDKLPNASRASIMVSTNLAGLYVGNASSRRKYYIDELFNPDTPVPDWAMQ